MRLENLYREIEALGGAVMMDGYDEGYADGLNDALAILRKYGFGVDMAPVTKERHFLAMDNDGHWYVIPVAKEEEWLHWCDLDPNNEEAWEVPDFAKRVGGAPCLVTFCDPEIA